ncbi:hypothetical protein P175DRAFT_0479484 [Aspergillus ochraceoroseus IBT 24754]|uniref:MARVEL domain-containing protein n=2 Tax=Aspergillus ochraceoroseus TaxID=138278 RepID=A0A2T5LXF5_9EURO|nr:uncharacterized protein P175DRAFT_0479484 [Aspergillus ochraceoroseus IBT 24754]KKK25756.1 hypothetical protein AOCH_006801 [Aspergillus ochraceoroseus]PTU20972.1 hypothetical protein P175DRAFT_0479484 [Aspergillus ochraceoroseus IBT 24754]
MASFPIMYPLRAVQAVFALIVLALTGHVINQARGGADTINFMLFNGIWTLFIVVPYFIVAPMFLPVVAHRYAVAAVDGVTMIFWFAGFIALATDLPAASTCGHYGLCQELQAAVAFGALDWALFVGTLVLSIMAALRKGPSSEPQPPTTVVP